MKAKSEIKKERIVTVTINPLELEIICNALRDYLHQYAEGLMWESNMGTAKTQQIEAMIAEAAFLIDEHNKAWRKGCLT